MSHVLKCDYDAIKQFLDSLEKDPGKMVPLFRHAFYHCKIHSGTVQETRIPLDGSLFSDA